MDGSARAEGDAACEQAVDPCGESALLRYFGLDVLLGYFNDQQRQRFLFTGEAHGTHVALTSHSHREVRNTNASDGTLASPALSAAARCNRVALAASCAAL